MLHWVLGVWVMAVYPPCPCTAVGECYARMWCCVCTLIVPPQYCAVTVTLLN
jgi:hypothetical protein